MTLIEFVDKFKNSKDHKLTGSLCFWGIWFGRPMDNLHKIISVIVEGDNSVLIIIFDCNERLTIWNPIDIVENMRTLQIAKADRILWEWYSYGDPQTIDNLYFEEYVIINKKIEFKTNVNWFKKNIDDLTFNEPAIALL